MRIFELLKITIKIYDRIQNIKRARKNIYKKLDILNYHFFRLNFCRF